MVWHSGQRQFDSPVNVRKLHFHSFQMSTEKLFTDESSFEANLSWNYLKRTKWRLLRFQSEWVQLQRVSKFKIKSQMSHQDCNQQCLHKICCFCFRFYLSESEKAKKWLLENHKFFRRTPGTNFSLHLRRAKMCWHCNENCDSKWCQQRAFNRRIYFCVDA